MPRAVTMAASSLQISGTGRGLGGAGQQDQPTERPVPRDISADSPVRPLADSLGMRGKECGGRGDCGPNSLACGLDHAGVVNVDGAKLRRAVVAHGGRLLAEGRIWVPRGPGGSPLTVREMLTSAMATWAPQGLECSAELWLELMNQRGTWVDQAFIGLAADLYLSLIHI